MLDVKSIRKGLKRELADPGFKNLFQLIKKVKNKNPNKDIKYNNIMWREQCYINYPLLYLASIYLYIYAKKKECNTFLFATRDCCHWYKIFKKMFPDMSNGVHYFDSSRIMFEEGENNHIIYQTYVNSLIKSTKNLENTIYIDIHGTGRRMLGYFNTVFQKAPHCLLLSCTFSDYTDFPDICQKEIKNGRFHSLAFKTHGSPIEMLNYDIIGTLQNYDLPSLGKTGAIRSEPEYDLEILNDYHNCMKLLIHLTESLDTSINLEITYTLSDLRNKIQKIFDRFDDDQPYIANFIEHVTRHQKIIY